MHAIIDTNVLIYDTIEDSIFHHEAQALLNTLGSWLIPSIVVYEYIWFFRELEFSAKSVNELIEGRISDPRCRIIPDNLTYTKDALFLCRSKNYSLSRFNDMLILSVAKKKNVPLVTFDKQLRKNAQSLDVEIFLKKEK